MKFKPQIIYHPKTKKSRFIYADTEKMRKGPLSFDTLNKISKTNYSPLKQISVRSTPVKITKPC